jgi:hypothetical protein
MGRPRTTGRFETRAELVERVRYLYFETDLSLSSVARNCRVSDQTANNIIESKEWETLTEEDSLTRDYNQMHMGVNLDSRSLTACGAGYDFPLYRLHIPDRIKRDLDLI